MLYGTCWAPYILAKESKVSGSVGTKTFRPDSAVCSFFDTAPHELDLLRTGILMASRSPEASRQKTLGGSFSRVYLSLTLMLPVLSSPPALNI